MCSEDAMTFRILYDYWINLYDRDYWTNLSKVALVLEHSDNLKQSWLNL